MNRYGLKRILEVFSNARKGKFQVICTNKDMTYTFSIDDSITVTTTNQSGTVSVTSSYLEVTSVKMPKVDYNIVSIKETILTSGRRVYTETLYNCIDLVQVYLPVFRVLGEQVVFMLKYKNGIKKMFFINGRVFYQDSDDSEVVLYHSDLRQVLSLFPNAEIILFEKLLKKYSYNTMFDQYSQMASSCNKSLKVIRKGVLVLGDVLC